MERPALIRGAFLSAMLAVAASTATEVPRVQLSRGGELQVRLPSSPIVNKDVRKQLTNGLTTVFVIKVTERNLKGGARIEVRYDLWDESYLVSTVAHDGRREKLTFDSYERFATWWRAAPFRIARTDRAPDSLVLKLQVLPFSAGEAADAERWLSDSVGARGGRERNDPRAPAGALIDAIVGTSVQRRPLLEYVWRVAIEAAE